MKITLSLTPSRRKALALGVMGLLVAGFISVLAPPEWQLPAALLTAGAALLGASAMLDARFRGDIERILAILGEFKVRHAQMKIRLDALEQRIDSQPMSEADAAPARAQLAELTAEVGLLGGLLQNVAQTLGAHEEKLREAEADDAPEAAPMPTPTPTSMPAPQPAPPVATAQPPSGSQPIRRDAALPNPETDASVSARHREQEALRGEGIAAALAAGAVEIHLQPVVQLPARRTIGYEALARLRLSETELLLPAEFLSVLEERGLIANFDALVLTRVLAVARFLSARPGDLFVSCNISATTWGNARSIASIGKLVEAYASFAGRLVLEMPQRVFRALDPASLGLIGAVTAAGARLALDQLSDLRLDPRGLSDRGVAFVKAPMSLLAAARDGRHPLEIDVSDLNAHMERAGVTLIGEKVEDDRAAAELIDLEVAHGQGLAFAAPRLARPEVFQEPTPQSLAQPLAPSANPAQPLAEPAQPPEERRSFRSMLRRASA